MCVGNVQPHPARTACADFDVYARPHALHGSIQKLNVADKLWNVLCGQKALGGFYQSGVFTFLDLPDDFANISRCLEKILIGDGRCRIDGIDNDIRLIAGEDPVNCGTFDNVR